jgi:hypothetical protein
VSGPCRGAPVTDETPVLRLHFQCIMSAAMIPYGAATAPMKSQSFDGASMHLIRHAPVTIADPARIGEVVIANTICSYMSLISLIRLEVRRTYHGFGIAVGESKQS